jgi:hypothetical protein
VGRREPQALATSVERLKPACPAPGPHREASRPPSRYASRRRTERLKVQRRRVNPTPDLGAAARRHARHFDPDRASSMSPRRSRTLTHRLCVAGFRSTRIKAPASPAAPAPGLRATPPAPSSAGLALSYRSGIFGARFRPRVEAGAVQSGKGRVALGVQLWRHVVRSGPGAVPLVDAAAQVSARRRIARGSGCPNQGALLGR